MEAVSTDLSKCLNMVTRGIKPKSEPLFPISSHYGQSLFNHKKITDYVLGGGDNFTKETFAYSKIIEGESFEEAVSNFGSKFSVEGSGTYGLATFSGSVAAEFNLQSSGTTSKKFSQIRKMAQFAKVFLPEPLLKEKLRGLLTEDCISIIDSVDSLEMAMEAVECFGPYYMSSATFGAILTISSTSSSTDKRSSQEMSASLKAELSYLSASGKAEASMNFGQNQATKNKDLSYTANALGGNPTLILNGKESEWVESAANNLACVDATFYPISNLAKRNTESEKFLKQAIEVFSKKKFDEMQNFISKIKSSTPIEVAKPVTLKGFDKNCEYKLFNKKWRGPLFCGDSKDKDGDHYIFTEERPDYENNGKERWIIECVDQTNQIYKLFNKKWKGPLFCGDSTDKDGDHFVCVEERPNYENNGKERWKIQPVDSEFTEFTLFNVKWGGRLFCGDSKDKAGDHWAWVEPKANYENNGKERWFIKKC